MHRRTSALLATLLTTTSTALAQQWERIDDDLRNLRGMCYLPVYPPREGATDYYGVASPTAMWFEYDAHPLADQPIAGVPQGTAGHVFQQLGWIRGIGINTVRVWMSYALWKHYDENPVGPTNEYVERVAHFVRLCEKRGLRVVPVLWDGLELGTVDYTDPIGVSMRSNWHASPERSEVSAWVTASPTLVGSQPGRFVIELATALRDSQALLMWDVYNEPGLDADAAQLIHATLALLATHAPAQRTTIALQWAEDVHPHVGDIARDPNLDVLGVHVYGHTRANIEAAVWDATHVSDGNGGIVDKPIVASEIGKPGWALAYRDALDFATGVPRPDLGPNERGIGFMPWTAMIGWDGGNFPFRSTDGIFFGDGLVRDRDAATAFIEVAHRQGAGRDLIKPASLVEWTGVGRTPQNVPEHADDWKYLAARIWEPSSVWANMSWDEFRETCSVFRMVSVFLHVGPISSASNPVNDPRIPGNVIGAYDLWMILWCTNHLWTDKWQISPDVVAILTYVLGEPFDPEHNPLHRALLSTTLLDDWRRSLLPYVVQRKGPYKADPR